MFLYGETFTRQRATKVLNPYSQKVEKLDWTNPSEASIKGCAFDPGGSTEPVQDGRSAVISRPTVYAPAGADVRADDRLVVRGATYAVDGNPADWRHPMTGWIPGLVIKLKDVEG